MKIIAFDNDKRGMAIRFLSQEIRLKHPGSNILVTESVTKDSLPKVDYLFVKDALCLAFIGSGRIYHLTSNEDTSMKDYHAEIMTLLPEILA